MMLISACLIVHFSYSQVLVTEVCIDKLPSTAINDYLKKQIAGGILTFGDIEASVEDHIIDLAEFNKIEREYLFNDELDNVWYEYLHTIPRDAWNCRGIDFNLLFSDSKGVLYYPSEEGDFLEQGQIIFLNLGIFLGLFKVPVAFKITSIENYSITFSYIRGNLTEGEQLLKFSNTKNGLTRIDHVSYYKSGSFIRDKLLYPFVHGQMIDRYHRNMNKRLAYHNIHTQ
jgi:hypothetical protein